MILSIFITIYAIGLIFAISGFYMKQPLLQFAGYTILVVLGFLFLEGNLEVPNGSISYVNGSVTEVVPQYSIYSNFTLGFILTIIPVWAFVIALFEIKKNREDDD